MQNDKVPNFSASMGTYKIAWEIEKKTFSSEIPLELFASRCLLRFENVISSPKINNLFSEARAFFILQTSFSTFRTNKPEVDNDGIYLLIQKIWNSELPIKTFSQSDYHIFLAILHLLEFRLSNGKNFSQLENVLNNCHDAALALLGVNILKYDFLIREDLTLFRTSHEPRYDVLRIEQIPVFMNSAFLSSTYQKSLKKTLIPFQVYGDLPLNGVVALTARRIRPLLNLVPDKFRLRLEPVFDNIDRVCSLDLGDPLLGISSDLNFLSEDINREFRFSDAEQVSICHSIYALGRSIRCSWAESAELTVSHCNRAVIFAQYGLNHFKFTNMPTVSTDLIVTRKYLERKYKTKSLFKLQPISHPFNRNEMGYRRGVMPFGVFSQFLEFDLQHKFQGGTLIEIAPHITNDLIRKLKEHPTKLYDLDPRTFEELIAVVFQNFGFDVELTKQSRDGGKDIIAISSTSPHLKYLIECKRYSKENAVGIGVVQRLHGVVRGDGAFKGIIATTSRFSADADKYLSRPNVRYNLEGRDFEDIQKWLIEYEKIRMSERAK